MNIYPLKFPRFIQYIFTSLIYGISTNKPVVYLTFDDGPTPEITNWVIKELREYQAKATFFCVGNNIKKHPNIVKEIVSEGHLIANHTYQHVKGWQANNNDYFEEVLQTEELIETYINSKKLFRPPHGQIKRTQIKILQKSGFKIVMWRIIVGDFSSNLDIQKSIKFLTKKTKKGDILVFHDSLKAAENLKKILPEVLKNLQERGVVFESL